MEMRNSLQTLKQGQFFSILDNEHWSRVKYFQPRAGVTQLVELKVQKFVKF